MFRFFKSGSKSAAGDGPRDGALLDGRALGRVLQHFPVGGKVQFYPEYRKEILLDSVVIAYIINGEFIYSFADLQQGSPDEVKRNPGPLFPDSTSFHPGYSRVG